MEKVYFQNHTKLPIQIYSGTTKEIAISPYSEDWFRLPVGTSDILIDATMDGYTRRRESHKIFVGEGDNHVNIRTDKIFEKKHTIISLVWGLFFLINSFIHPPHWTFHLGFLTIDFYYIYWTFFISFFGFHCFQAMRMYKMLKEMPTLFKLEANASSISETVTEALEATK
ncbi:hypothetical protein V7S76_10285 [Aquirufa sp. ROCK2-A2]